MSLTPSPSPGRRGELLVMSDFLCRTAYPDRYELLKAFAKENRRHMIEAERVLWDALRRQIQGYRFRRQHPIGDYIVDFINLPKRLVIEVDGGCHSDSMQQQDDEVRTQDLERLGYSVIRFSNEEVIYETKKVIETIKNTLYNK